MSLLDLLMPPACAACGRSGKLLCADCLDGFEAPSRPADRFLAPDAALAIGDALSVAMAAFAYEGPIRRALAALKYTGASRLAPTLARAAGPTLRQLLLLTGPATLVPVPLHIERRRARGYNQAEHLARHLVQSVGMSMADPLERARPTTKQHRLNRVARLHNLRGAFVVREGSAVPRTVILVDDIITTTATLEACASVLRDGGCRNVYGFALAREV
ncbi:MAG: ComF family protein [Candidatus Limnocylindria bacterium]